MNATKRPWWVNVSLLGTRNRATLWLWIGTCLAFGMGMTIYFAVIKGRFAWPFLVGGLLAALPYYLTIRWLERRDAFAPDGAIRQPVARIDTSAYD